MVSLLERESAPTAVVHAGARRVARLYEQKLVPTSQLARPQLGLAGLRIDVGNRMLSDTPLYTRVRYSHIDYASDVQEFRPPEGSLIADLSFSPNGEKMALTLVYTDHIEVGILDPVSHEYLKLNTGPLNGFWGKPCSFIDETSLLCSQSQNTGEPPVVEIGPNIRELMSGAAPVVPYSNLLRDANDDRLFEHYAAVVLARVQTDGSAFESLEVEGMILEVEGMIVSQGISPDGRFLFTNRISRPYPRQLPANRFTQSLILHDLALNQEVFRNQEENLGVVNTATRLGPRLARWDPTRPSTLVFVQRIMDEQNSSETFFELSAPFAEAPLPRAKKLKKVSYFGWTSEGRLLLTDAGTTSRSWVSYELNDDLELLHRGSEDDLVGDPSQALRVHGDSGAIFEKSGKLFFKDERSRETGAQPILTSWELASSQEDVLWESKNTEHAEVLAVLNPKKFEYLLATETPSVPRHLVVTRERRRYGVTQPAPPHPELFGMTRRMISYQREDGLSLSAMLSLPPNAREGIPLPMVLWIYPRDFADSDQASKSKEYPQRYIDPKGVSRFFLISQGYAILDCPMPIVGEVTSGRNDFLPQLIQNAEAAINYLTSMRIAESERIAVMGHSYGAFAVANLLAHSTLFKTGIATSGAYNRTLTPFGFQRETRTFWQNTDAYVNMSPFFFANEIQGSLLMFHGEADDNAGTPILQSERFYAALVGNGVRTRYVSFPFEGHHLRGRDAVLHSAAEMLMWLNRELAPEPAILVPQPR